MFALCYVIYCIVSYCKLYSTELDRKARHDDRREVALWHNSSLIKGQKKSFGKTVQYPTKTTNITLHSTELDNKTRHDDRRDVALWHNSSLLKAQHKSFG